MLAVHFGAGNIGRGFIGNLLYHSGYETYFVDINKEIVNGIKEKGQYKVVLADENHEEQIIKNVNAINSAENPEEVIKRIVEADLVTTAIGPNVLPFIAELLAKGLKERASKNRKPLNIIACENMIGGSSFLKEHVYKYITEEDRETFDALFAFPDSAVDRIVPNQKNEDPLMVIVEPFYEWVVEETKIVGKKPPVNGITYVKDLEPFIERKLFTVNTGHALTAYFGYHKGFQTIDQALRNEEILSLVKGALGETGEYLVSEFQFDKNEHEKYMNKIIGRFSNPYITDEVTRVGRSPLRKLGPEDRLIRPAREYTSKFNKVPQKLVKGIVQALHYDFEGDEEAVKLQQFIKEKGIEEAVHEITKLEKTSLLFKEIVKEFQ